MGEAEIQSAVEAAAVIFKKVVIQRRKAAAESKAKEEGQYAVIVEVTLYMNENFVKNKEPLINNGSQQYAFM